jgi:hypothetical protein
MNNKFEVVELNNDQRSSVGGAGCPTGIGCPTGVGCPAGVGCPIINFILCACEFPVDTGCPVKQCCTDPNGFGCYTDYNCGPDSIDDRRDF